MADNGVRLGVNKKFAELVPKLAELTSKGFRKAILEWTVKEYNVSWASACTHYNFAKTTFTAASAENAKAVEGLGRAPGKNNGGRKKGSTSATKTVAPAATGGEKAPEEKLDPDAKVWCVKRKKDGEIVASGLTEAEADKLIQAAKDAKKAALFKIDAVKPPEVPQTAPTVDTMEADVPEADAAATGQEPAEV